MIQYKLTNRAWLVLDLLDNQDGQRLRPTFGYCSVCREPVTVWRGLALCVSRTRAGRCHGNGRAAKPRQRGVGR